MNGRLSVRPWALAAALACASALAVLHARSYLPLFVDDGFISLRYASRLAEGGGLTWNDGERVEGYSNLLYVLVCAGLGRLGVDGVAAARAAGIAGMLAAVAAAVHANRGSVAGAWGSALAVACCAPLCVWAVAGLEASLFAGLIAWAVALAFGLLDPATRAGGRPALLVGALLALVCVTRVDGVFFALAVCALVADRRRPDGVRLGLRLAVLPLAATLGQLAFRRLYYGRWLAHTTLAKVTLHLNRLAEGIETGVQAAQTFLPLVVAAGLAVLATRGDAVARRRVQLAIGLSVAWAAYTVAVRSEPLAYRSLVPVFVLLAMLAGEPIAWGVRRGVRSRLLTAGAGVLLLGALVALQRADPNIGQARSERVAGLSGQSADIGLALKRAFGSQEPLLAVDAAGAVPYFSELPALDMLGLCDPYLVDHRPASFGLGLFGHELGDGDYVLRRAPDILLSGVNGERSLAYRGGAELQQDPRFARDYRQVLFRIGSSGAVFYAWIRQQGRLGVQREPGVLRVPGLLFATTKGAFARIEPDGATAAICPKGGSLRLARLTLEEGLWTLRLEASEPATVRVTESVPAGDTATVLAAGTGALDIEVQGGPRAVDVHVDASGDRLTVHRWVASRHALKPPSSTTSPDLR